ncbi:MAG: WG repeat-containing protein [Acidobacteria bacterium]|nr:WG repeat-containing protein [Acidobacteriota bacterium]MBI3426099.1 WG repeat-containing protein [Acidobacteriota bacterium]
MQCFLAFLFVFLIVVQPKPVDTQSLRPVRRNGLVGYIDQTGNFVIPPQFQEAGKFSEGLAPFRIKNKWGYINARGQVVIPAKFFQAMPFKEGLASVGIFFEEGKVIESKVGRYGYIDKTGRLAINQQFDLAIGFSDGLASVITLEGKHCFINQAGDIVFQRGEPSVEDFAEGRALFKTKGNMPDSKVGYLNKKGVVTIPPRFQWGNNFKEGCACVYENGKAGFIDADGKSFIEFKFEGCDNFSEGLAAAKLSNRWGYINNAGNFVIEPQFAEAKEFSDGTAVVSLVENGKFGAIDKSGQLFIQPRFTELSNFSGGLAWANLTNSIVVDGEPDDWAYINKQGNYIWRTSRLKLQPAHR